MSRRAFEALGHEVWSADFEPAEDGAANHYQGDCFDLIEAQHFDLMIAHPPCTHLAVSGARHFAAKKASGVQDEALAFVARLLDCSIARFRVLRWKTPLALSAAGLESLTRLFSRGNSATGKRRRLVCGLKTFRSYNRQILSMAAQTGYTRCHQALRAGKSAAVHIRELQKHGLNSGAV